MMRGGLFGYPGMYGYPGSGPYSGYRYEPHYGMQCGYPQARMMPNWFDDYYMPVEIPVTYEKSPVPATADEQKTKVKNAKFQENQNICCNESPRKEIRHNKRVSPNHCVKGHSPKPYAMRQVPLNDMQYPEMEEDDFPYVGVPHSTFESVQAESTAPNSTSNVSGPQVTLNKQHLEKVRNVPIVVEGVESNSGLTPSSFYTVPKSKATVKTSGNKGHQEAATKQHPYKVRNVPIVMEGSSVNDENAEFVTRARKTNSAKQPLTPMEQLMNIQKDMDELESRVENFSGDKKDKQFIILDETMTGLLLKLDMIESNGVEEIRNKRRQLVRQVQDCVQKLESKVVGIVREAEESKSMEVDNTEAVEEEESVQNSLSGIEVGMDQGILEHQGECFDGQSQKETPRSDQMQQNPEDQSQIEIGLISSPILDQSSTEQMDVCKTTTDGHSVIVDADISNEKLCSELPDSLEAVCENESSCSTKDPTVTSESEQVSISQLQDDDTSELCTESQQDISTNQS